MEVAAVGFGDGICEAEEDGDLGSGIGEEREVEAVLFEHEDVLARGLGGDGYGEGVAAAELRLEVAPGFRAR